MFAFCSTISIATPDSCTCWMISKLRSTRIGARPIDGSSISSSFGWDISARPIATICCSPPESVPASWLAPLVQQREQRRTRGRSPPCGPAVREVRAHLEVLQHGHRREQAAVLGHDRHAAGGCGSSSCRPSRPRRGTRPSRCAAARARGSSSASSTCPTRCRRAARRAHPRAPRGRASSRMWICP